MEILIAEFEPQVAQKAGFFKHYRPGHDRDDERNCKRVVRHHRLRYKYNLPNDIAGKTGTTQNNKDGWFVGITPELVSVTWAGTDDPQNWFSFYLYWTGCKFGSTCLCLTNAKNECRSPI